MYSPFDLNEAMAHRNEFVEEELRGGSPVVGVAYEQGLLLLTLRRSQRKVYEIYDRQMFSAIGRQADIENVRLASIQMTHQEGFERSPDDVSVQRLVGFALSPSLKKAFGDQFTAPFVLKGLFAELGRKPEADAFFVINYDGEFRQYRGMAAVAGTAAAEVRILDALGSAEDVRTREEALRKALQGWIDGAREVLRRNAVAGSDDTEEQVDESEARRRDAAFLRDELKSGVLEVGLLERDVKRESRFRLLDDAAIRTLVEATLGS